MSDEPTGDELQESKRRIVLTHDPEKLERLREHDRRVTAPAAPPAPPHSPEAPAHSDTTAPPAATARCQFEQEIRFAIVMYGGVSLAIYINGVAQELLRLVRATAPAHTEGLRNGDELISDDRLGAVEGIYRELGCLLGGTTRHDETFVPRDVIRTRFVVDVISGTSAGGINGIFLANALARHVDMEELRTLWISEGEISKLLNDAYSVGDLENRLPIPRQPRSLLNSQRMYIKLLEALQDMKPFQPPPAADGDSALVEELDLYVTATDLKGLLVKLKLADRIVYERRYRSVFRFLHATKYGTGDSLNDFKAGNLPFHAFAARCTSSFPVAFEPMTLKQAKELLGARVNDPKLQEAMKDDWPRLYRDYRRPDVGREQDTKPVEFEIRPFGDGGYLDNKPFGHAIAALRDRRTDLPVRRKLLYVEPSPEHPELDRDDFKDPPDAIENLMLAASSLPRQETIREDLERILERNRQIEYVVRATRSVGRDFVLPREDPGIDQRQNRWHTKWLNDVTANPPDWLPDDPNSGKLPRYGGGYGAYHRLKVSEVTTELADAIARILGLDDDSDEATAVRFLASAWRQAYYQPYETPGASPENEFLMKFDLSYRLRRLRFVQQRIQAYVLDSRHAGEVLKITESFEPFTLEDGSLLQPMTWARNSRDLDGVRGELRELSGGLAAIQTRLRKDGRDLRHPGLQDPIRTGLNEIGITWEHLKRILVAPDTNSRITIAKNILNEAGHGERTRMQAVHQFTETIAQRLETAFKRATEDVTDLLHPASANPTEAPNPRAVNSDANARDLFRRVRHNLWHQYRRFDYVDMALFPMLAGADLGELSEVEVLRVSPEDAPRLIQERDARHHLRRSKLAGTRLGHFGAFFDPIWRRSDILWGRLDAAERIVRACSPPGTPDPEVEPPAPGTMAERLENLLGRLQCAIVCEELSELPCAMARSVFVEALLHTRDESIDCGALNHLIGRIVPGIEDERMKKILTPDEVRATYLERFEKHRELAREKQAKLLSRSTEILGRLLDGLTDRYVLVRRKFTAILMAAGRTSWGLIEITMPRSVWELLGWYWLYLLYALEAILVIAGQLGNSKIRDLGLALLAGTFAVDICRRFLRVWLLHLRLWNATRMLGVILLLGVVVLGVLRIAELSRKAGAWLDHHANAWWWLIGGLAVFAFVVGVSRWIDEWVERAEMASAVKADRAELEKCRTAAWSPESVSEQRDA